jgi:hypothetical protein
MPRRNRVDPWGDLHAVTARGMFTGNRGCVVDENEQVVRHHSSSLWITCKLEFRDWKSPLARGRRWTPLFFLDEAVALAAGHRPCAFCRRNDYLAYRDAVGRSVDSGKPLLATELNARLIAERHRRGRGLERAHDRITWETPYSALVDGTVVVKDDASCQLVRDRRLFSFEFDKWSRPVPIPPLGNATVLTPPTSVAALQHGYRLALHSSAFGDL